MRKVLTGLALLAPALASAQTTQIVPSGAPTVGYPVTAGDGQRATIVLTTPADANGNPLGTATNPLNVANTGSGAGNTTDVQGTGTLNTATANATYVIPLTAGRSSVGTRVSGLTGTGATLTVERTNDGGTTWTNANTTESNTAGSLSATLTADGQPRIGAAGATAVRFRVSTTGTGTVSISYNATTGAGPVFFTGYIPGRATADGLIIGGVDNRTLVGNTISTNVGAADAGTQRIALATGSTVSATQGTSPWVVSNGGTFAVQNNAATPAGTNSIGTVGLNAGTNAIGSVTANIGTTNGLGLDSSLQAIWSRLAGGVILANGSSTIGTVNLGTIGGAATAANQQVYQGYNESGGRVALAASASTGQTQRASPGWANYFKARAYSDQTATLYIAELIANGTPTNIRTQAITAGTTVELSVPIMGAGNNYYAYVVMGSTAGNVAIETAFTQS